MAKSHLDIMFASKHMALFFLLRTCLTLSPPDLFVVPGIEYLTLVPTIYLCHSIPCVFFLLLSFNCSLIELFKIVSFILIWRVFHENISFFILFLSLNICKLHGSCGMVFLFSSMNENSDSEYTDHAMLFGRWDGRATEPHMPRLRNYVALALHTEGCLRCSLSLFFNLTLRSILKSEIEKVRLWLTLIWFLPALLFLMLACGVFFQLKRSDVVKKMWAIVKERNLYVSTVSAKLCSSRKCKFLWAMNFLV